jgi:ADP-ribose pyrophosphatase YjhB (NUDIX family)
MKFCDSCAGPLARKWVTSEMTWRLTCEACAKIRYDNPKVLVACAIYRENRMLVCKRADEPARGKWTVPSGFLECGETLQEGAAREAYEETGLLVPPDQLVLYSIANMVAIEQVIITFRYELTGEAIVVPGPECSEVAFMSHDEILDTEFAWIEEAATPIGTFFEECRTGAFGIHLTSLALRNDERFESTQYKLSHS